MTINKKIGFKFAENVSSIISPDMINSRTLLTSGGDLPAKFIVESPFG